MRWGAWPPATGHRCSFKPTGVDCFCQSCNLGCQCPRTFASVHQVVSTAVDSYRQCARRSHVVHKVAALPKPSASPSCKAGPWTLQAILADCFTCAGGMSRPGTCTCHSYRARTRLACDAALRQQVGSFTQSDIPTCGTWTVRLCFMCENRGRVRQSLPVHACLQTQHGRAAPAFPPAHSGIV